MGFREFCGFGAGACGRVLVRVVPWVGFRGFGAGARGCVLGRAVPWIGFRGFGAGSVSVGSVGSARVRAEACSSVVGFRGFGFGSVRFRVAPRGT